MVPETCFVDAGSSGRICGAKLDSYGPELFGASRCPSLSLTSVVAVHCLVTS